MSLYFWLGLPTLLATLAIVMFWPRRCHKCGRRSAFHHVSAGRYLRLECADVFACRMRQDYKTRDRRTYEIEGSPSATRKL
jgi:hypothetical protein